MNSNLEHRIAQLSEGQRRLLIQRFEVMKKATKANTDSKNTKRLVAYIKLRNNGEINGLKNYLKNRLPDYLVPSAVHKVDSIPYLPNGKVDKIGLRQAIIPEKEEEYAVVEPTTEIEKQLVSIWEEVLDFSPIGIHDNFFEIGGDSLLSIQVISKARKQGIPLKANELFEHQSIAELNQFLEKEKEDKAEKYNYITTLRKEGTKKPLFCIHSGGGHVFFYKLLAKYMKPGRPIYAIQPTGLLEGEKMHDTIEEMTRHYLSAIKDIQPQGPYNVLVHCFSTSVGHEMAIHLTKRNEQINIIVADNMASPWNATSPDVLRTRILSFFKRLFLSPVKTIRLFVQERYYHIDAIKVRLFGKDFEKELERLKANLRRITLDYEWKETHNGQVSLLLTDKPDQRFQELIINSWKKLALGGVRVYPTKGEHTTLFEEPDVEFVSEKIDECII